MLLLLLLLLLLLPTTATTPTTPTPATIAVAEKPCTDGLLASLGSRHTSQLHVGGMHELRAPEVGVAKGV